MTYHIDGSYFKTIFEIRNKSVLDFLQLKVVGVSFIHVLRIIMIVG